MSSKGPCLILIQRCIRVIHFLIRQNSMTVLGLVLFARSAVTIAFAPRSLAGPASVFGPVGVSQEPVFQYSAAVSDCTAWHIL